MDEKSKLLKLRAEVQNSVQTLENALNHLRDYLDLFDTNIRNLEIAQLRKEIKRRKELA